MAAVARTFYVLKASWFDMTCLLIALQETAWEVSSSCTWWLVFLLTNLPAHPVQPATCFAVRQSTWLYYHVSKHE
jgi:hypothetical protein